jgi:hypothetical protein
MRRLLPALAVLSMLASPAAGQDFDLGLLAYDAGDYATALREFRLAAEQGNAMAQYNVGVMTYNGEGVAQNFAEAAEWYRRAAAQGYARAQSDLGDLYARGEGVPQDRVEAHKWYSLAAARGDAGAAKSRDRIAAKMTPAGIAAAERMARE